MLEIVLLEGALGATQAGVCEVAEVIFSVCTVVLGNGQFRTENLEQDSKGKQGVFEHRGFPHSVMSPV